MASVRFGAGIVDARGSISGQVFSRNHNGAYIRARTAPINPDTPAQTFRRNLFGAISSAYKQLTAEQVQLWVDAARGELGKYTNRLGESSQYTAQQLYMSLNATLEGLGATQIDVPPVTWSYPPLTGSIEELQVDPSGAVTFVDDLDVDGYSVLVYSSLPVTASVAAVKTPPMSLIAAGDGLTLADVAVQGFTDMLSPYTPSELDGYYLIMRVRLVDSDAGTKGPDRTFKVPIVYDS